LDVGKALLARAEANRFRRFDAAVPAVVEASIASGQEIPNLRPTSGPTFGSQTQSTPKPGLFVTALRALGLSTCSPIVVG